MELRKSKWLNMKRIHIMKRIFFIAYITLCYNVCLGQTLNGHEYVDLGLPSGTKWATCNIGATIPEEYGDYFAWGETSPKTEYSIDNYKYWKYEEEYEYEPSTYLLKYNIDCKGVKDNKKVLETTDDAAYVNWGKGWRMPTKKEFDELYKYCTCMEATSNGVKGQLIVGPNNNYIFLPNDYGPYRKDLVAYYWSSSLYDKEGKYNSYDHSNNAWINGDKYMDRSYGLSVRPVCNVTSNTSGYKTQYNFPCKLPAISTKEVSNITAKAAMSGGSISPNDCNSEIIERGVFWFTENETTSPFTNMSKDGSGVGDFSSKIVMLKKGTIYDVCAYAVVSFPNNIVAKIYGPKIRFTTTTLPILSCNSENITQTSVKFMANIEDNLGEDIFECGFCWSKSNNPTINDYHLTADYRSFYYFSGEIYCLDPGTTYYLRAYVKSSAGTAYSFTETFTTKE